MLRIKVYAADVRLTLSLGETQSGINTFARDFYFKLSGHNILIRSRSRRLQKKMAEPPTSQAGEILIGKASGGRRPPGHDHRAIVALVADVARRRQLCVGRGELVAVLGPECPVADRQRIFDRRRDQIGEGQIPIFRQDFGNLGEGFAQLIQLIGGMA